MPDNYDAAAKRAVPARHLHARPRRHRARAAVHDEVDDRLHVEAARRRRRSLHAAAVRPLHEREPVRRRDRRPRGDRVGREGLSDRSQPDRHDRVSRWAARRRGPTSCTSPIAGPRRRRAPASPRPRCSCAARSRRQPQNAVQQTLWHMYDSTDYAVNTFNVPVVAYSGGIDAQKQAADAMAAAMLQEGLTLEHIIGPNTGHAYEPRARQQVQDRLDRARGHGPESASRTRFASRPGCCATTGCSGSRSMRWRRSGSGRASTRGFDGRNTIRLTTANVTRAAPRRSIRAWRRLPPGRSRRSRSTARRSRCRQSGATARYRPALSRRAPRGDSASCPPALSARCTDCRARSTMRSWTASCSCGRAGQPLSPAAWEVGGRSRRTTRSASGCISSAASRASSGTPRSPPQTSPRTTSCSSAIRRATPSTSASRPGCRFDGAPDGVVVGGETYSKDHAPVFIFPNPLNPKKYVVINSGFTFHDQSNNDMQSPKLPDWAVVDIDQAGQQLPVPAALRRIAGILRRGLEAQRADEAVTRNRISISFQAEERDPCWRREHL